MLDLIVKECRDSLIYLGFYQHMNQPDSDDYITEGGVEWIKKYNQKQLDFSIRKTLGAANFVVINEHSLLIREETFNPVLFPNGRSF